MVVFNRQNVSKSRHERRIYCHFCRGKKILDQSKHFSANTESVMEHFVVAFSFKNIYNKMTCLNSRGNAALPPNDVYQHQSTHHACAKENVSGPLSASLTSAFYLNKAHTHIRAFVSALLIIIFKPLNLYLFIRCCKAGVTSPIKNFFLLHVRCTVIFTR